MTENGKVEAHTIALPSDVWERLEERKARTGIPISQQIVRAMREVIADESTA